jgi:tetratricopeptide (TPR) repeat protein
LRRRISAALARWGKKDAQGAYEDFDHLIRIGAQLPGAYNGRGRTLLELMNDPDRALPDLDAALRLRPEGYVLPYIARARAHYLKKNYDAAIADATKAISISGWEEPFRYRGLARLEKGDRVGARADLEEAQRRSPPDPEIRRQIAGGSRTGETEAVDSR